VRSVWPSCLDWSVSGSIKGSSNSLDITLAISSVLFLAIAHVSGFVPNTNAEGLSSFSNSGTTTSLSSEDNVFNSILLSIGHEHVFLIANSNTAFLRLSVTVSCLHQSSMFIAVYFLCCSIILWHVELICGQLESLRSGPLSTIMSINTGEYTHVSNTPGVGGCVEFVLNLVNVSIPRHSRYFFETKYWKLKLLIYYS